MTINEVAAQWKSPCCRSARSNPRAALRPGRPWRRFRPCTNPLDRLTGPGTGYLHLLITRAPWPSAMLISFPRSFGSIAANPKAVAGRNPPPLPTPPTLGAVYSPITNSLAFPLVVADRPCRFLHCEGGSGGPWGSPVGSPDAGPSVCVLQTCLRAAETRSTLLDSCWRSRGSV